MLILLSPRQIIKVVVAPKTRHNSIVGEAAGEQALKHKELKSSVTFLVAPGIMTPSMKAT